MSQSELSFEQRVRKLSRKHQRMSDGVVHRVGSDGLITAYPRRRTPRFPLRGLLILVAVAFLFKAFLLNALGAATYNDRLSELETGTVFEQAGAWVMQADPATIWLADVMADVLPRELIPERVLATDIFQ
jgi:hypothetical protein